MKYRLMNAFHTPELVLWRIDKKIEFLGFSWWVEFSMFGSDYYIAQNKVNQLNGFPFIYDSYDEMVQAIKAGEV